MDMKFLLVLLALGSVALLASDWLQTQSLSGWFVSPVAMLEGSEKIVYAFDEVEVLYAARFTVYPSSTSVAAWAEEIAEPGEEITATYGIVILKNRVVAAGDSPEAAPTAVSQGPAVAALPQGSEIPALPQASTAAVSQGIMQEEWLKLEGSRGS